LRPGKVIQNLNPSGIDEIDMGTIQMHGFLLSKERPTLAVEESGPLCGDLAL
jgi:nucleoside 2-deoxyribosyltransferase